MIVMIVMVMEHVLPFLLKRSRKANPCLFFVLPELSKTHISMLIGRHKLKLKKYDARMWNTKQLLITYGQIMFARLLYSRGAWRPWHATATSYAFSDLHITGEFDNYPGTRLFLRIFPCVVTYRTGVDQRLYMITSADARPGSVRRRSVPGRRCKRSDGHRTMPGRFYTDETNFHVQWCIMHYFLNLPIFLSRNRLLK